MLGANAVLMDAYDTDVRPLLAEVRTGLGLDPDPIAAYARSGYGRADRGRTCRWPAGGLGRMSVGSLTPNADPPVAALLERSNRLGSDPRNTNYAGGNTSAKGVGIDPATGAPVELLWVKGSGGDLGTLTETGLAVLRLDRLRALVDVYPGVDREDEMVAAFDYCLHGRGGAAPSIDTAMHGLIDADHVDHLHPDFGHRPGDRRRRGGSDTRVLRRPGGLGRVAAPGFPARAGHGQGPSRPPRGDRRDPRRARDHRLG